MKNLKSLKLLIGVFLIIQAALMTSCKSETELTQKELVTAQLVADGDSWGVENVTVDDVDESGSFNNFSIKFEDKKFTTVNGGVVWPPSGTWSFTSEEATAFTRDDGIKVLIESLVGDQLSISFEWAETTLDAEGGRITSRKGKHKFKFKRKR
ncbi:MAG: hypothetical protein KF860_11520 [Cyclobacteriaceae bacterium]|nr:hypothetical protein [Cyclobacteriaceae bacterium]